ncbi:dTDP-4-dehydrorhamnose 3,5-epimerase [Nitratireductor sp. GISD-1A_MAKvit]|uniref:dTDP-4-dehydrorhamnose 3,5-epimerase n=1 Tax=Nitratireductor sp. GISD-1A_MAKvit TaxID=3234198 RepID=UPI0034671885
MVEIRRLELDEVLELHPPRYTDHRGFFSETYSDQWLEEEGKASPFVQDNHSFSVEKGTLRGLHYQLPPMAQDKLVRVVRGRIYDVAVDIRRSSPTFGRWVGLEISAEKWNQILVPKGFAHGFVTLEPDTEVVYKVSALYAKECERAVRFDDLQIAVEWPLRGEDIILSEKDEAAPFLSDADVFD